MIVCQKCGKENQDHYKFCLGCGAELSKSAAPKAFAADTPPHGVAAGNGAPVATGSAPPAAAPPAPAAAPQPMGQASVVPSTAPAANTVQCPQCGQNNPTNNRFCAACGYNLSALKGAAGVGAAPPAPAAPAAAPGTSGPRVILTALRADGSEAGSYALPDGPNVSVGRDTGSIFAGDSYLSPRHATLIRKGERLTVRDEGSLNGTYIKLKANVPWPLGFGDIFRIGQEIVRFEKLESPSRAPDTVERLGSPAKGYIGRLALVIGRDTTGNAFPVPEAGVHCGRERGDILFSEDGYVSGLHCRIAPGPDGRVYLTDVGSSNGTFVRLNNEQPLNPGDILLMGQQLFRMDMHLG